MAVEETEFTQVFRGYDKDEVDRSINQLRREIISANNASSDAQKENKRLLARIEELTAELEEVGSPTFSGLGTKLENTLRVAEEQSTRLIAQADIDAEKLRRAAEDESHLMRSDAHELAERTLSEARAQANRLLENARAEADDMVARAHESSEQVRDDANRDAASIRGTASTEAAEVRATAKREA
ncbi:DivIVA domain-containing protein, partial [Agromyces binzhouensis]